MNEAIRFLHALAQSLSTSALYTPGHPATRKSATQLWQAAQALLAVDTHPVFLFLGTAPVYAGRALHDLRDWQHSGRLAAAGVQRLEFDSAMTLDSLHQLVDRLSTRLSTGQSSHGDEAPLAGVVYGVVTVVDQAKAADSDRGGVPDDGETTFRVDLVEELDAMQFVRTEAARGVVARAEADAVVHILAAIVDPHHLPQVNPATHVDRYHVVHPVNTALLAMTASAAFGLDATGRHRLGLVALLHDIGMAVLPAELGDMATLTDAQRAQIETHTALGADLLLRKGGAGFDLAAVVAFEHHQHADGSGYPARRLAGQPHWASRMVACCATFAALRAVRPFRPRWPTDRVVRYIDEGAGTEFDAEIGKVVAGLVRAT